MIRWECNHPPADLKVILEDMVKEIVGDVNLSVAYDIQFTQQDQNGSFYVANGHPIISLRDVSDKAQLLFTFGHELVHLKQHLNGRLKLFYDIQTVQFDDEWFDLLDVPYDERPWEQDAKALEKIVFDYYLGACSYQKFKLLEKVCGL